MRLPFMLAVVLATVILDLARADITGPARVIDGDTLEIASGGNDGNMEARAH